MAWRVIRRKYYMVAIGFVSLFVFFWAFSATSDRMRTKMIGTQLVEGDIENALSIKKHRQYLKHRRDEQRDPSDDPLIREMRRNANRTREVGHLSQISSHNGTILNPNLKLNDGNPVRSVVSHPRVSDTEEWENINVKNDEAKPIENPKSGENFMANRKMIREHALQSNNQHFGKSARYQLKPYRNNRTFKNPLIFGMDKINHILQDRNFDTAITSEQTKPKGSHVIISGRYRTGSSFVGSFFQYHPKVHYTFKPLQFYPIPFNEGRQDLIENVAESRLRSILHCDYQPLFEDVLQMGKPGIVRLKKWWGMSMCRSKDLQSQRCDRNVTMAIERCMTAQHRVIKEITLSNFSSLVPLMQEGIKVIHLVRDPRGQVNSIMGMYGANLENYMIHFRWKLAEICADLRRTFQTANEVFMKNPRLLINYKLVRYEDIAKSPLHWAKELYHFTNIAPDLGTLRTLEKSTSKNKGGVLSVTRNSTSVPFAWMKKFPDLLKQVAEYGCCDVLQMLGYPTVNKDTKIDIDAFELEDIEIDVSKPYKMSCPYQPEVPKPFLVLY